MTTGEVGVGGRWRSEPDAAPRDAPVTAPAPSSGHAGAPGLREPSGEHKARRSLRRRLLRWTLVLAVTAVVAWSVRGQVTRAVSGLGDANLGWVALATVAEGASMAGLARQQRRLVGPARRHRIRMRSVLATTYGGNAISVSLPVAGSSLSTAFTYHRYIEVGAAPAQVVAGLAVSGVLSASAFAAVVGAVAIGSGQTALVAAGVGGLLVAGVPLVAVVVALHSETMRRAAERLGARLLGLAQRLVHRPAGDPAALAERALEQLSRATLRRRDVSAAFGFALLNWTADVVCLGLALRAVGAPLPWYRLGLAWSAGAGASSLNLTPGSIGVVEAALTAALVGGELGATRALTGVLVYRLVSFWLVLVVGLVILALRRHAPGARRPQRT